MTSLRALVAMLALLVGGPAPADPVAADPVSAGPDARASNRLGMAAILDGRLVDALDHLEAARRQLDTAPATGRPADLDAAITHNLAATYLRLGWLDEARDALQRTLALYRRDGASPTDRASTWLQLARVERLDGQVEAARAAIDRALALDPSTEPEARAPLLEESAWVAAAEGRFDLAEERLRDAIAGFGSPSPEAPPPHALTRADLEADLGELALRRGDAFEALQHLARAGAWSRAADSQSIDLEAHRQHLRSRAYAALGDLDTARQAADAGLLLLDATRHAWKDAGLDFFARRRVHVRHRIDLAARADDAADAWAVAERHLARGLVAGLADRDRPPDDADALRQQLLDALHALDTAPIDASTRREVATKRLRHFRAALRRLDAVPVAEPAPAAGPVTPTEARNLVDGLVLVYVEGASAWYIMTLAPDTSQPSLFTLDAAVGRLDDAIDAALRALDSAASLTDRQDLDRRLATLADRLLRPIAEHLGPSVERLVVVAESRLADVPFEALPHPGDGRPLIEHLAIAYPPSLSALAAGRRRRASCRPPKGAVLAVGDPVFGARDPRWPADAPDPRSADESLQFFRLPASAEEVEAVEAAHPGPVRTLLGAEATRRAVVDAALGYRLLHLATHARADRRLPPRSKLALSCVDADDRAVLDGPCDLYLPEVAALELCGPLVVASACATAAGPRVDGEGVLGLPRAFLHAGASAVVASRWRVDDRATARLMTAFHRHLADGVAPVEALRRAQVERRRAGEPATTWAAFSLFGDPSPQPLVEERVPPR